MLDELLDHENNPTRPAIAPPRAGGSSMDFAHAGAAGTRVGHYTLTRLIGSGGMGAVYEAVQDQPRRTVAVKLIRHAAPSPGALRRFEFESQTLARLRHSGIAQVYEAGTHHHLGELIPFYAMEFIPNGKSITDHAAAKKLSVRQRLELFADVCDAVHHAHERGILHRDLKPQNILIDNDGRPKVIDFGIARGVDSDLAPPGLQTSPDQLLGTLQYMSPEQLEIDPRQLDRRADVYAMGVILYELLCGRLPYEVTPTKLADASRIIREQPPYRPRTANAELNADLETVVLKALHKDRERRYQTARELGEDIRRVLHAEPIGARRDSATYVLGQRIRAVTTRHPVGSILLGALAALVAAMLVAIPAAEWSNHTRWFARIATQKWTAFPPGPLEHVRLVTLSDKTDLVKLEEITGIKPGTLASLGWTRAVVGQLMSRLANCGPSAVSVDIVYRAPTTRENDDALLAGVESLRRQDIDAVFAVPTWTLNDDGSPVLFHELALRARWGVASAVADVNSAWRVHLALQHEGSEVMPGLALATHAAARHPGVRVNPQLDPITRHIELVSATPSSRSISGRRIAVTSFENPGEKEPVTGQLESDDVAEYYVAMPPDATFEASAIDLVDALQADDAMLREWFTGKVVVVGGYLKRDRHRYGDGRELYGCQLHAAAINSLEAGLAIRAHPTVRIPLGPWWGLTLPVYMIVEPLVCLLGTLVGFHAGRANWSIRLAIPFAFAALVVGASVLMYRELLVLYSAWTALFCGISSYFVGLAIARSCRRHRI